MASNGKRPLKGKREISNTVGKVGDKGTKDSFSTYKESQLLYKHMNNMVNDEQHLELLNDEYVTLNGISIDLIRRELTKLLVEQIRAISIHDNLFSVDEHLDENHVLHTDFQAIEDIQYNGETGDWTITSIDNSVKIINTPVENFLASATFDPDTHILTLTLTDGFTFSVDLTELMDMYDVIPDRGLEIIERNFGIKDSSVLREMLSLELATDIAKIPGMVEDIDLLEEKTQTLIDEQISSVKIYSQVFNSIVDNILDLSFEAIRSISYNQSTGAFTVTSLDDSVEVIPTDIVTDFTFDEETYKLRIDLTNEKSFEVDLTYLIDAYGVILNSGLELINNEFGIKKASVTKAMLAEEVLIDRFYNPTNLKSVGINETYGLRVHQDRSTSLETINIPVTTYVYGVRIDTTNSNPETSVTYTDDAVGMIGGSSLWNSKYPYNMIKPCLLKDGVVNYYLDPNDYTKKIDGSPSDIVSGNDGDVMMQIPKCAYMIYTEGNYLYVKITNSQNAKLIDSRFTYLGHTRDIEGDRDFLYVGAYLGYELSGKLRSLSDKTPTTSRTLGAFRTLAHANGSGYDQLAFYPLTLMQCLWPIRYKHLHSQLALGQGFTASTNTTSHITGGTNQKGLYFGEQTGTEQMKLFGIEDFWGNCLCWVDGLKTDSNWHILTATDNFNDVGIGYVNQGQGAIVNTTGYTKSVQGGNTTGFIQKVGGGSSTTYFADLATLYSSGSPTFGGAWDYTSAAGIFRLYVTTSASTSSNTLGSRIMYL